MDSTMNSLSTQASMGIAAAALALVGALSVASMPILAGLVSAAIVVGLALVAFAAQARRLRDEERLVYRPVYVRRQDVQRRVISDDR